MEPTIEYMMKFIFKDLSEVSNYNTGKLFFFSGIY